MTDMPNPTLRQRLIQEAESWELQICEGTKHPEALNRNVQARRRAALLREAATSVDPCAVPKAFELVLRIARKSRLAVMLKDVHFNDENLDFMRRELHEVGVMGEAAEEVIRLITFSPYDSVAHANEGGWHFK